MLNVSLLYFTHHVLEALPSVEFLGAGVLNPRGTQLRYTTGDKVQDLSIMPIYVPIITHHDDQLGALAGDVLHSSQDLHLHILWHVEFPPLLYLLRVLVVDGVL